MVIISSKTLHEVGGIDYRWLSKHFKHLALDWCEINGNAQYNLFKVSELLAYINTYKTACKNPSQVRKSFEMMNKLKEVLNAATLSRS